MSQCGRVESSAWVGEMRSERMNLFFLRHFTLAAATSLARLSRLCSHTSSSLRACSMPPSTPRLPLLLQLRILNHLYVDNVLYGGADYISKMKPLLRLANVCKTWREHSKPHKYSFATLPFQWFSNSEKEYRLDFEPNEYILQLYENADVVPMLLRMDFDAPNGQALSERDAPFRKQVERSLEVFHEVPHLQLEMRALESGSYSDLVWRFIRKFRSQVSLLPCELSQWILTLLYIIGLKKLTLSSRVAKPDYAHLSFPPKPSMSPLPSTLVRLDLVGLVLDDWTIGIPSVKVLTLDHVKFGSLKATNEQTSNCCRNFFDSFPSLDAIAFNKLGRLAPDALSRLKVYGITQLRLGPCSFRCICEHGPTDPPSAILPPFSHSLARYFRCKIKYFTLPSIQKAALLEEVLSSRPDQPYPPYLAKLHTVSLHSSPFVDNDRPFFEIRKKYQFETARKLLDEAGLKELELNWIHQDQVEVVDWEPRSYTLR